jgi:hypothetical protein
MKQAIVEYERRRGMETYLAFSSRGLEVGRASTDSSLLFWVRIRMSELSYEHVSWLQLARQQKACVR